MGGWNRGGKLRGPFPCYDGQFVGSPAVKQVPEAMERQSIARIHPNSGLKRQHLFQPMREAQSRRLLGSGAEVAASFVSVAGQVADPPGEIVEDRVDCAIAPVLWIQLCEHVDRLGVEARRT